MGKTGAASTYTIESSVAAMDAMPAIHVAAASNFCPVPPAILIDGGGWDGLEWSMVEKPPLGDLDHVGSTTERECSSKQLMTTQAQCSTHQLRNEQGC